MKIVLASNNPGKIKEFSQLLKSFQVEIIPQAELGVTDIEETGLSFIENAILKARHASSVTGLPALSDDSGLVVRALYGAPGIYSARYAGKTATAKNNIQKLLQDLKTIPDEKRDAHFHCTLVFMSQANDPAPLVCEGNWSGTILHEERGEHGFGYDPIFFVPTENCSAAELTPERKNKISHRGFASSILLKRLSEKL